MPYKTKEDNRRYQHKRWLRMKKEGTRKKKYAELKNKAYYKLGNKCNNLACQWLNSDGSRGCTDRRCLQVDHVNGGGYEDYKESRDSAGLYLKIIRDTAHTYQLLCANCNWIKRSNRKESNPCI